ncbi:MAG: prolyl oligopeptidase family serine peptidase [Woeseiaceae bacterium]|nr:prolyl oligopeptidase family serine peptidase [Woeseiaceae bacterium]
MRALRLLLKVLKYAVAGFVLFALIGLIWLRWESHLPRDAWFVERQGRLIDATVEQSTTPHGQLTESVVLESDSGLAVTIRVIRSDTADGPLPVLIVLGGHRTGSDAVDLFGHVGARAVVGVDYPYDGPERVKGVGQSLAALGKVRRAFLDTVPAVALVADWIGQQAWADQQRIVVIGASLGVPFAATAAARDSRLRGAMLVHGAADNRLWLEAQVARRIDTRALHYPLSVLLHWLAYGPVHDTPTHIAAIAPRPVVIIGAREDERTPAGQAERLFELAGDPKRLRFTHGAHIEPDRVEIIAELLAIADEELAFLVSGEPVVR